MGVATYAPPAQRIGEELVYPDGRHELADDTAIRDSPLYNTDLAPVAELCDLLGDQHFHHPAGYERRPPVRKLGGAVRADRRARAAGLDGGQGGRLRTDPQRAGQSGLG